MDPQRRAKDAGFSLRCVKDKLLPVAGTALVAALLIAVISLAAPPPPQGCPDDGIGVGSQCFYFVEDAADWDGGQRLCLTHGAQLAAVRSPQELGFVLRYGSPAHYWIGLRRDGGGPWTWLNGTRFNHAFSIAGSGRCAHTAGGGIGSAECAQLKPSVCSRPQGGGGGLRPPPPTRAEGGGWG